MWKEGRPCIHFWNPFLAERFDSTERKTNQCRTKALPVRRHFTLHVCNFLKMHPLFLCLGSVNISKSWIFVGLSRSNTFFGPDYLLQFSLMKIANDKLRRACALTTNYRWEYAYTQKVSEKNNITVSVTVFYVGLHISGNNTL